MAASFSMATESWRFRGLLFCNAAYWLINWVDNGAMGAFYRTIVHCDSENAPVSRYEPGWSGSMYCTDKDFVIARATEFSGYVLIITFVIRTPCLLAVGAIADRFGRKNVALLSYLSWVIFAGFMFLASTDFVSGSSKWNVILFGVFVSNLFNAWTPVSYAMAADMSEDCSVEARHKNLSALSMTQFVGTIIGFSVGFWLLTLVLENYMVVWLIFTVASAMLFIASVCFLNETLRTTKSNTRASIAITVWRDLRQGFAVISRDAFLAVFIFLNFLLAFGAAGGAYVSGSYQMIVLDYTQSTASLASVQQQFPNLVGVYIGVWLQKRGIGPYSVMTLGIGTSLAGWLTLGLAGLHSSFLFMNAMFWTGYTVVGLGIGLVMPVAAAILSARVSEDNQAKVQAVMQIASNVGQGVGGFIWTTMFFDAEARGFQAGLPFLYTAAVMAAVLITYLGMLRVFGNDGGSVTTSDDVQAALLDTQLAE